MKTCNRILGIVTVTLLFCAIGYAVAAGLTIEKQERRGPTLIVTYSDGTVKTNSLFLAMSPEVKAEIDRVERETMMVKTLGAVVSDTRANIPETTDLSDAAIAMLYLSQMPKNANTLAESSPSNTVEYLIGAGMRQDINKGQENE